MDAATVRERERLKRQRQRQNPEMREREAQKAREYRAKNGEQIRARRRAAYAANKNKMRQWRAANREEISKWGMRDRHGPHIAEWFAETWETQAGCCYLCRDELVVLRAVIDHDHRCCPDNRSCARCRRGLTCSNCNTLIGMAQDDPERLRRIADNLEAVLAVTRERLAAKPEQLTLEA